MEPCTPPKRERGSIYECSHHRSRQRHHALNDKHERHQHQCVPAGDTVLAGALPDQARLYGVLRKVRNLSLPLVSVMRNHPAMFNTQGGFA